MRSVRLAAIALKAHGGLMPTDEHLGADQIKILRAMSGQEKLRVAQRLFWTARNIKAARIRTQNPDWPKDRIEAEVTRMFSNARS
jgi:hypothetical protein